MAGRVIAGRGSAELARLLAKVPPLEGAPIRVSWRRAMRAHRGRLVHGGGPGEEVHAATFVRRREVALDSGLRSDRGELARILIHEVFHFAWVRLANRTRAEWEALLAAEVGAGARGELGWSSQWRKARLRPADSAGRTRRWREYVCESFCDTAAWLYGEVQEHEEFTLALGRRRARAAWFESLRGHPAGFLRI
jgi:hypothetical protein